MANYRDESRKQYGNGADNGNVGLDGLNAGSLQRIADAAEHMTTNYVDLQNSYGFMTRERDRYKGLYDAAMRANRSLKANITKLKKQIQ